MTLLRDALTLDKPRRTADGYLAVRAKAARTGVYRYAGFEVDPDNAHGLRDAASVNVLRDQQTVFDAQAAHSFIGKPITDDHPKEAVTKDNWRDHARGTVMGAKWEEGGYLAFDLLLTDAEAIAKVDAGKRELSNGYDATLEFGDFTAPGGTKCQARQTQIRGNHVALVDRGRAGPECRIADAPFAICDANLEAVASLKSTPPSGDISMKTLTIDGLRVPNVSDEAEAAITKLQAQVADAQKAKDVAETQVATLATDKATLEAKVTTLEKQVSDAKLTPQALRDAAKAYQSVVDKAKALSVAVTDEMDEPAIRKAVVAAKLGDAAKDWTDAQIAASFDTLTKDVKAEDGKVQPIGQPIAIGDAATQADTAWTKANDDLNAWRAA